MYFNPLPTNCLQRKQISFWTFQWPFEYESNTFEYFHSMQCSASVNAYIPSLDLSEQFILVNLLNSATTHSTGFQWELIHLPLDLNLWTVYLCDSLKLKTNINIVLQLHVPTHKTISLQLIRKMHQGIKFYLIQFPL